MSRPWFGPKRFGIGYGPASWQGWLATALYAALMIGGLRLIAERLPQPWHGVSPALLVGLAATAAYFALIAFTGRGKVGWRWGGSA